LFYQNSIFVADTYVDAKSSSAIKQRAFGIRIS